MTDSVSSAIHGLAGRSGFLDGVMRFCVQYLIYVVIVAAIVLWFHTSGPRAGLAAVIGGLVALGAGALIGHIWTEARPFVAEHFTPLVAHASDGAFPSDHLLLLGGITGGIWCGARRVALAVLTVSVVVAIARVYAGIHYSGDVLAGFLIGFACGIGAWYLMAAAAPLIDRVDDQLRRRGLRPILLGRSDG